MAKAFLLIPSSRIHAVKVGPGRSSGMLSRCTSEKVLVQTMMLSDESCVSNRGCNLLHVYPEDCRCIGRFGSSFCYVCLVGDLTATQFPGFRGISRQQHKWDSSVQIPTTADILMCSLQRTLTPLSLQYTTSL